MRAHRRAQLLDKTLRFYEALNSGSYPVEICLLLDRPTREVEDVVKIHRAQIARLLRCPFPILSYTGGDRFMDAANYQLTEGVEPLEPNFVIFSDDDRWPEETYFQEHKTAVDDDEVDCWYIKSLFFWDSRHVRTDFFDHNSIFMWRHRPLDRFDESYNQAPEGVHRASHRSGRIGNLSAKLLDYGYSNAEERRACFEAHTRTGRLDQVTLHLLDRQVQLKEYNGPTESSID